MVPYNLDAFSEYVTEYLKEFVEDDMLKRYGLYQLRLRNVILDTELYHSLISEALDKAADVGLISPDIRHGCAITLGADERFYTNFRLLTEKSTFTINH